MRIGILGLTVVAFIHFGIIDSTDIDNVTTIIFLMAFIQDIKEILK